MTIEANGWRVSPELHETPEGRFIVIEDGNGDTVAMLPEGSPHAALIAAAPALRDALRDIASGRVTGENAAALARCVLGGIGGAS